MLLIIKISRSKLRDLRYDRNVNFQLSYWSQYPKTIKILMFHRGEKTILEIIFYSYIKFNDSLEEEKFHGEPSFVLWTWMIPWLSLPVSLTLRNFLCIQLQIERWNCSSKNWNKGDLNHKYIRALRSSNTKITGRSTVEKGTGWLIQS